MDPCLEGTSIAGLGSLSETWGQEVGSPMMDVQAEKSFRQ